MRFIVFLLPCVLVGIGIELFLLKHPNTFNVKAVFIQQNKDIKMLVLGSSHNQRGINPEFLDLKTASLAYGSQDLTLDHALFFRYIKELKELKYLFLEIDYHTLDSKRPNDYFRYPWYYRYHGLRFQEIKPLYKWSLCATSPEFFKKYLLRELSFYGPKVSINKHGFVYKGPEGIFNELDFDSKRILETAKPRLKALAMERVSEEARKVNKEKIHNIIQYCSDQNIEVLLVSAPLFTSYLNGKVPKKDRMRQVFIDSLLNSYSNTTYLNFEDSKEFKLTDFRDDDHLNPSGAKKFTKILNSYINALQK